MHIDLEFGHWKLIELVTWLLGAGSRRGKKLSFQQEKKILKSCEVI